MHARAKAAAKCDEAMSIMAFASGKGKLPNLDISIPIIIFYYH